MRTKPVEAIRPLTIKRRRLKVKTEGFQAKLEREGEAERERDMADPYSRYGAGMADRDRDRGNPSIHPSKLLLLLLLLPFN